MKKVKPKARCCQSRPRCKRCPVVLKRLERAGLATRKGKTYRLSGKTTRKQLAVARTGKGRG
jgi:hypothetical protein